MKAKRYGYDADDIFMEIENGRFVLATDHDALLALARQLRQAWYDDSCSPIDEFKLYRDSAWLEEREE